MQPQFTNSPDYSGGQRPPAISKAENHLPRNIRVTLSQLRSGQCARLRNFQLKIGKTTDDLCPSCSLDSQTVSHLFDCPANPTTLTTRDLWSNPWGVADHLRSFPCFDDLPPPPQPPQPPPRRRPLPRPPPAPDPPASPIFTPLPFSPPHTPLPSLSPQAQDPSQDPSLGVSFNIDSSLDPSLDVSFNIDSSRDPSFGISFNIDSSPNPSSIDVSFHIFTDSCDDSA